MKRISVFLLAFFFTALSGFTNETIELLTTEYQPFCGAKGDTMWCELINTAFAREGIDIKWTSYPQEREKILVSTGTNIAFLSGTLVVTPEEKSSFIMNESPLIYLNVVAFFPKDKYPKGLGLKSENDLKGKTVGVIRGTGSVAKLQKAEAVLDVANDKDQLIQKLVSGRNDIAVVGDLTGLGTFQEQVPEKAGNYKYELVYNSPIDLIFSQKNPRSIEIKTKYDSGIAKIKADGTYMKILAKYYPKGEVNMSNLPKDMQAKR
jgi:polar amino acid transport system substrate-binding protein